MSSRVCKATRAPVVDMVELIEQTNRRKWLRTVEQPSGAKLLSIRQSLVHHATVGLADQEKLINITSDAELGELKSTLRSLLYSEFGSLRVHRYRQLFSVGHHSVESLIAGVLRVQFHIGQLNLNTSGCQRENDGIKRVGISWGVGETVMQAEYERQRNGTKSGWPV